jgi:CheY-like chemotaxis protein
MDVQMPVIDGYRATHLIRHHDPYKASSGAIPIVAMTASAIQGDREKCMRAGMDDYIAKPVKGKTLEKTLDRWAIHGRTPHTSSGSAYAGSECNEDAAHRCKSGAATSSPGQAHTRAAPEISRPSARECKPSGALIIPCAGRSEGEANALKLKVDRLAEAVQESRDGLGPCGDVLTEGQELTFENVGRLEREVSGGEEKGWSGGSDVVRAEPSKSGAGEGNAVGSDGQGRRAERPRVRRWPDSQRTITGL